VKVKEPVNRKIAEECIRELKVHGLVKDGVEKDTYVITEKALNLMMEAMRHMRQNYPKATKEQVKIRALIVLVLEQFGDAVRKYVPVYVGLLDGLTENFDVP
jgi:predicted transcriptional regulator